MSDRSSPDIEGARLSNWLADYSHDLKEEGDFDQEAAEVDRAAQWIADRLASKPATPIVGRLRRAMESTTDEVARNDLREIVRDIEAGHSSAGIASPRQQISDIISGELGFDASPLYEGLDKSVSRNDLDAFAWRVLKLATDRLEKHFTDAAQESRNDALRLLADLFSESAHETWTKDEIVNIIEDVIRLGSPPSSTDRGGGVGWDHPSNRFCEPVETRAEEIYRGFSYDEPGEKPAWNPGGNSIKQDEARAIARSELRAAGFTPSEKRSPFSELRRLTPAELDAAKQTEREGPVDPDHVRRNLEWGESSTGPALTSHHSNTEAGK